MNEQKRKIILNFKKKNAIKMGDNINLNMFHYMNNNNNYHNYNNRTCLSSSSNDISNLLHHILVHSSSSSSSSSAMAYYGSPTEDPRRLSPPPAAPPGENVTDEYDCESEEGLEALLDETAPKAAPSRSSSKRSRAAEVHNLSEKRRRSRINEKIKALQNLIPNSNKTDKASMLDEAIEYLKQLQLQVQMLSMRNGLSLHPMCLPGVLQPLQFSQTRMDFSQEGGSLPMNVSGTLPANQETSVQMVFDLPNQCNSLNPASVPNMSNIITSETSFGLESIQAQFGPFQLLSSSQDICREDILHHQQLETNTSELFGLSSTSTVSLPYDTRESDQKEISRDQSNRVLLKNMDHDIILSSHLTGKQARRSDTSDGFSG